MDWIEIAVRTNTAGADMVSEQLMCAGAKGTSIEDPNDFDLSEKDPTAWDLIDPEVLAAYGEYVVVRSYLPDDASSLERVASLKLTLQALTESVLGFDPGPLTVSVKSVHEEDWAENWKKYYKPFRIGKRLVVKPVWETFDRTPDDLIIAIDPGMAFGNGTHETTFLCLQLLEDVVHPGDIVLDVGTGSGILSIAAARLGAAKALAVDLDPVAVRVAGENIERNGLSDQVTAQVGDLLKGVDTRADVVVANIIADVIILLSKAVHLHIKPGGAFISSGIIRDREDDVVEAIQAAGFSIERIERKGEWIAIVARAENA